jgi:hypothetical protein
MSRKLFAIVRDKDDCVYYSEPQDKIRKVKLARLAMLVKLDLLDELAIIITDKSILLMMYDFKIREFTPLDIRLVTNEQIQEIYNQWISQLRQQHG